MNVCKGSIYAIFVSVLAALTLTSCFDGGDSIAETPSEFPYGLYGLSLAEARARSSKVTDDFVESDAETAARRKTEKEKREAEEEKARQEAYLQKEKDRKEDERMRKFNEDYWAAEAEKERLRLKSKQESKERIDAVLNYLKDQLEASKDEIAAANEAIIFSQSAWSETQGLIYNFQYEEAAKLQEQADEHRKKLEEAIAKLKEIQAELDLKIKALPAEDQFWHAIRFENDNLSLRISNLERNEENYKFNDNSRNLKIYRSREARRRSYAGVKDSLWAAERSQPIITPGLVWSLTHPPGQHGGSITGREEISFRAAEIDQSVYLKIHKLDGYEVGNPYVSPNTYPFVYSAVYREPNKKFQLTIPGLSDFDDGSDDSFEKAMKVESLDLWSDYDVTNAFISIDDKVRSALLETHVLTNENLQKVNAIVIDGFGNFSTSYGGKGYNLRKFYLPSFSLAKGFFLENSAYAERRPFVDDLYYGTEPKQLTTLEAVDHISSANYKGDIFFSHMYKDKDINLGSDENSEEKVDISNFQASKVIFKLSKIDDKSFGINLDKIDFPSEFDLSFDKNRMGSFEISNLVVSHQHEVYRVQAGRFLASDATKNDASIFNVSTSQVAGEGTNLFKRAMWIDLMPFGYNADEIGGNFVMHLDRQKQVDILTANFGIARCGEYSDLYERSCVDTVRD